MIDINRQIELINKLHSTQKLTRAEYVELIENRTDKSAEYLFSLARAVREEHYGKEVYTRGLVEFSNYCKNDCLYCGIRKSNLNAQRYRLTKAEILECCIEGYELGFRTFVLQSGEDASYSDDDICEMIRMIKGRFSDCAITLSIGEKSRESYQKYFDCGAERFLLRHETANYEHYSKLHPSNLTAENRQKCLRDLKEIGYQVGTGFMVGSPYQTAENLAEDMEFITNFQPHMVGIGPFISHKDTPFAQEKSGNFELTLFMLGLLRLALPKVLLPSTTALGTINPQGREMGIMAGANVVMPNLSPTSVRKKYLLYDNKICTGDESAQCVACMERRMNSIGYHTVVARGDSKL